MKRGCAFALCIFLAYAADARATVFINEFIPNPPGSFDSTREFIELCGTPGKKLDGYALAFLNGTLQKFYNLNSIPPIPVPTPEIDEFFSLDGLALGANGLLVLAISSRGNYPEVLTETTFRGNWATVWNGGLDTPGQLQNDGSNTLLLIRHRPGITQADPTNPLGLQWGKAVLHDSHVVRPVIDPQDDMQKDQWGDGKPDQGELNGYNGGFTRDLVGALTPLDTSDDLEIVDEVSYEHERGWEYDCDDRHVDTGSNHGGLPRRRVHALDDPQGFNPDALARVDYRQTGVGWLPAPGGVGELPTGRNWQDTATEQWVRGETTLDFDTFEFFFDNTPNAVADVIQPYATNVPLWLADGAGVDYNFSADFTYGLTPGRMNPLSIAFIPGDADRDGDCDSLDIAKIAAVFGDDDWIFSNAFADAPEGDEGNPADQVRPWDVDATGSGGVEPGDLQWTLNFQGNTNGRIVGVRYDSTAPATMGVTLQPNAGVQCAVTRRAEVPSGHPLGGLAVGEFVDVIVSARVSAGANLSAGQQNGIMQFIHDLAIDRGGVLRVVDVQAVSPFVVTRASITSPAGTVGDAGATSINGHTTSFTQGLSGPVDLYRVRSQAIGLGAVALTIEPAALPKFTAGTPDGLKLGHTAAGGNPSAVSYPPVLDLAVTQMAQALGDCDLSGAVTLADVDCFTNCMNGPEEALTPDCEIVDFDADDDGDLGDWARLEADINDVP